ncbi:MULTISPECIES: Abi family protein [Capnocytophaga]|jgi:conserved hypothetical phage abiD protein|uniref:Abi family protein n=1 Tax=Capnocytophaga TaxID=1016 RepID=UPI00020C8675|nr:MULTISPECIES: Abi family protein [unclassified Capnocytophaga]KHE69867.1 Abi-like protein [Capnocytophaga sp. oral taxon 329 str. F0087]MBB1569878.1 Abi family protein [Capnocytophaga sp.]QGS16981.1 Abi family protein [Capnocytophaga sp. FDAARGOS_737]
MARKARSIEEQIKLLKKRGMIFDDEDKAEQILEDVGYYRLGFYWYHFQKDFKKHLFLDNTHFSTVINLYYLDVDLRFLLIKVLSRIEINLRTRIIHIVSNHYKDNPFWFADKKIMKNQFVDTLDNFYTDIKKKNKVIAEHHRKYPNDKYAPAWKTLEFMTLGSLYTLFTSLKEEEIKTAIASKYRVRNIKVFDNYFKVIRNIRNICSHTRVLYDLSYYETVVKKGVVKISDEEKNSLSAIIKVISYFLQQISANRANDFQNNLKELFLRHSDNERIMKIIKDKSKISLVE